MKKAVFATPHNGSRAAYDATVTTNADGNLDSYQVIVAAKTGKLLYRQSQVDNIADNPTWLAPRHSMPYNNLNAFPWNYPTTDNRVVHCWNATAGCAVVRGDNPATTVYPVRRCLEVPVGRPAERRRHGPRHDGNNRQQRRRRPALEREPRARCDRLWQPDARPGDERNA